MTIVDDLLESDGLSKAALDIDEDKAEKLVEERRINTFSTVWAETSMSADEVLEGVKRYEEIAIEEYGKGVLPEWLIRAQTQDMVAEFLIGALDEDGDVEAIYDGEGEIEEFDWDGKPE